MKFRPITQKDYAKVLELDKKVYPTDNPVTSEIIQQWYQRNPEFGIVFENRGKINGMCIAIPLNKKGWKKLINGKLAEGELNSKTIFDNSRDKEIGIHIYHIEKFDDTREFHKESLTNINFIINKLRETNPKLKIIGFSALAVTSCGIGLFYNKFNCRERKFINDEHILRINNKLETFKTNSQKELEDKLNQGYEYLNRCKMLVLYPNEPSVVWNYLK